LPAADDHLCGICLPERDPPFDRVIPGGLYADALQDAIHRFKYRSQIDLDRPLARLLLPQLTDIARDCDLILPVPLHPRKLRQRTYNQSLLIARILAPALGLPLATSVLIRHRDTLPQQGQDAASRRKNLHNAFRATRPLAGTRILLIDDVLTTGATARECSRSLKKAGGGDIVVAVLARAPAAFRN
jgi:ComF family protein